MIFLRFLHQNTLFTILRFFVNYFNKIRTYVLLASSVIPIVLRHFYLWTTQVLFEIMSTYLLKLKYLVSKVKQNLNSLQRKSPVMEGGTRTADF